MDVKDTIGTMSTGALLALGTVYIANAFGGPDTPTAPVALSDWQAPAAQEVTRSDIDLLGQSTASQISRIVSMSAQGLRQTADLTPEQAEVIKFFERAAREMNQLDRPEATGAVRFSNMAVQGLNVRYFYRVPQPFGAIDSANLLDDQRGVMRDTLCTNDAIRTLLSEYGFAYIYTYISDDSRQLGQISADQTICV